MTLVKAIILATFISIGLGGASFAETYYIPGIGIIEFPDVETIIEKGDIASRTA